MKISKLSLILLSSLLFCQGTLPMENQANSALKKAQKAGKIALRIGAGTATLGVYALLGTAALASWGITLGAAAVSLARFLTPKAANPKAPTATEPPKTQAPNSSKAPQVKRPQVAPKMRSEKAPKNTRTARYTEGIKVAGVAGLAAVENDVLDPQALKESRMTQQQLAVARKQKALEIQAELEKCNDQKIQWQKDYTRIYHAERPRFEGPYQEMIGILDGDLEDMRDELGGQMKAQIDFNLQHAGCNESINKLQTLAHRMAQDQMRLPK